jgi:hypothetical protein
MTIRRRARRGGSSEIAAHDEDPRSRDDSNTSGTRVLLYLPSAHRRRYLTGGGARSDAVIATA